VSAIPLPSIFSGALQRRMDGRWYWADTDEPEPRVSDLTLQQCAPPFRCATYGSGTVVEIPHDWRAAKYWPQGRVDAEARQVIAGMIADGTATPSAVYAEGLAELADDHRLRKHGYTLPIAAWDAVMGAVCGASWDAAHEAALLARTS